MAKLTADDRGPGLNIGMWIMFVPTAMMVAAKIYTKWHTTKKIGADDVLIGIAFVSCNVLQLNDEIVRNLSVDLSYVGSA